MPQMHAAITIQWTSELTSACETLTETQDDQHVRFSATPDSVKTKGNILMYCGMYSDYIALLLRGRINR